MAETSKFAASLRKPFQWIGTIAILSFLLFIFLNSWSDGLRSPQASTPMVHVRAVGLAMFQYAQDHDGQYPTGNSSTEIFQKLIDKQYVDDASIFFDEDTRLPGKIKARSNQIKSENVCWDVTLGVDQKSGDHLPVVFSTGFRIEYTTDGNAVSLSADKLTGIIVCYSSNSTTYLPAVSGVVKQFIYGPLDNGYRKYVN